MKLSAAVIIPILSLLSRAHADGPAHSQKSCHGCWKTIGADAQWLYADYRHFIDDQTPALQCLYKSKYDGEGKIGFSCEFDRNTGLLCAEHSDKTVCPSQSDLTDFRC